MNRKRKLIVLAGVSLTAALGLAGCSSQSTPDEQKAGVEELQKRGFEDVQYVNDTPATMGKTDAMIFTGKFGQCRLDFGRDRDTQLFTFRDLHLSDEQRDALKTAVGANAGDTINASFVRAYAPQLGLQHCL